MVMKYRTFMGAGFLAILMGTTAVALSFREVPESGTVSFALDSFGSCLL